MSNSRLFAFLLAAALAVTLVYFLTIYQPQLTIQQSTASASQDAPTARAPISSLRDLSNAFVDMAAAANPSVVTVFTEKTLRVRQGPGFFGSPFNDFFGEFFGDQNPQQQGERELRQQGLGSGVVVSQDGYILTNNHVISGADTINVRFMDGTTEAAEVIGADEKTDIAVLKVDKKHLTIMPFGDSDELRVGEMVLAIGSPLSVNLQHSVTSGIVSAKGRSNVGLADYEDFIQTDAAINPGNSGGPLINLDGQLVGINTAIVSRSGGYQGIGFAVPSNMAKHVMDSLIEHGSVVRGWLGVYIQDLNEDLAKAMDLDQSEGALIADLTEDGPGEKAGLKRGDVIVGLDGETVENSTQLRNEIASRAPGSKAELQILRDGKSKKVELKLGELPTAEIAKDVDKRLEEQFGFSVAPFDGDLAKKYHLDPSLHGVVITDVTGGGPGARTGLREGDLIVEINRAPIKDLEEFNESVRNLDEGATFLLRIVRQNRSFYAGFQPLS